MKCVKLFKELNKHKQAVQQERYAYPAMPAWHLIHHISTPVSIESRTPSTAANSQTEHNVTAFCPPCSLPPTVSLCKARCGFPCNQRWKLGSKIWFPPAMVSTGGQVTHLCFSLASITALIATLWLRAGVYQDQAPNCLMVESRLLDGQTLLSNKANVARITCRLTVHVYLRNTYKSLCPSKSWH